MQRPLPLDELTSVNLVKVQTSIQHITLPHEQAGSRWTYPTQAVDY